MVPASDRIADADVLGRMDLMVAVTAQVLAEDRGLTLCEALRLVDAARVAVLRHFPEQGEAFDQVVRPRLDAIIEQRFGLAPPSGAS